MLKTSSIICLCRYLLKIVLWTVFVNLLIQPFVVKADGDVPPIQPWQIIAYYPSWGEENHPISGLPVDKINVINYAFLMPDAKEGCVAADPNLFQSHFSNLQKLKQKQPDLKVILSIGGWGTKDKFNDVVKNYAKLEKFINSCISFLNQYNFDGLDIDWEYPEKRQKGTFITFISQIHQRLSWLEKEKKKDLYLTIAAPADIKGLEGMDVKKLLPKLDWINLMTYDYAGPWSEVTGHNAPLFRNPKDSCGCSVDDTVKMYLGMGIPSTKLVLGIPFYGHGWSCVKNTLHGLFQPFVGLPQDVPQGYYPYSSIKEKYIKDLPRYWDEYAKVPWLYNSKLSLMITYDDQESITLKTKYARQNKLAGVMIWELSADDRDYSLLRALYKTGLPQP